MDVNGVAVANRDLSNALGPRSEGVSAAMSVRELALTICRQNLAAALLHEPKTRAGDAESLHEMRVSLRRLDASTRLFKDYLPKRALAARRALRWLIRVLGATRDLDVQLACIREHMEGNAPSERAHLAPLERYLEQMRRSAAIRLLKALDSPRTTGLISKWSGFARAEPVAEQSRTAVAERFALRALRKYHRRIRKSAEGLTVSSSAEDYHDVRSRVKRLRYALDAFAPLFEETTSKFQRSLLRLQDVLGEYQDAHVRATQLTLLASAEGEGLPRETLFLMGQIAERNAQLARKARRRVDKAYQRIRGRRWKELLRTLSTYAQNADTLHAASSPGP